MSRLLCLDTRKAPKREKLYLFSGMIFCGECGRSMVRRNYKYKGKESVYYICSTYNKGNGCSRHSIKEKDIEEITLTSIKKHMEHIAGLDQILTDIRDMEVKYEDVLVNDKEIIRKYDELNQCKKMELSLHKDLLEGVISQEEYMQFGKIYSDRASAIEHAITVLRQEVESVFCQGLASGGWIREFAKEKSIHELNRYMVLSLIEKIIIHEDSRIEIFFKYEDEYKAACRITKNFPELAEKGVSDHVQDCEQIFKKES